MAGITRIDRYIAKLIGVPLVATLVIAVLLLVLDKMLRLFDFVTAEGGSVSVVWRMIADLIPTYMSIAIPIGLTLGILLTFRRLALTSELDVLQAFGLGFGRLLRIPFAFAVGMAGLNWLIVDVVEPNARYAYAGLRYELRSGALGASINVGDFTRLGERVVLRVEQSRNGGRALSGLFVTTRGKDGKTLVVTAEQGQFLASDDPDRMILRLSRGVLVHESRGLSGPRVLRFRTHDLPINLPKVKLFRARGDAENEMTFRELITEARAPTTPIEIRRRNLANFHFRLVKVATIFLTPFLAIALAIPPKRSASGLGVFLSIVILIAQLRINLYAEDVAALGRIDPVIAFWGPFALFAAMILWMYHRVAHVPGGRPIAGLEDTATLLVRQARRFSTTRYRSEDSAQRLS